MNTPDFLARLLESFGATYATLLAGLGDRLGLGRELAPEPATAAELAARTGLDERYVAEWCAAMTAAGFIEHDPGADRFTLPSAHAVALANEGHPLFVGGSLQGILGMTAVLDQVTDAFRTGAGVPYAEYPADVFEGMARMTGAAHDNVLVPRWLPLAPSVQQVLERGARVIDVGCGQGRAVLAMALAYPRSTFVGIDGVRANVDRAGARAGTLELATRVKFVVGDAIEQIPDAPYDIASAFDVLHDARDPVGLLRSIRGALTPDGQLLLLEPNVAADIEGNVGPRGAMVYGMSVLYCMSVSLASGGPGLGTCGTPEPVVRDLCSAAGFTSVEEVPIDNLFNRLYLVR